MGRRPRCAQSAGRSAGSRILAALGERAGARRSAGPSRSRSWGNTVTTRGPISSDPTAAGGDPVALHQALVDQLRQAGCIRSTHVEAAFRAVPRHPFLPGVPLDLVYRDEAIPIKELDGATVSSSSQPAIMAVMLEQLEIQPGHRVLEIGAGTGYNAALMAHIVGDTGQVVTVDLDDDLVVSAREHLEAAGFSHVQVVCGD